MRDRQEDDLCRDDGARGHGTAHETADVLELLQGAMTLAMPPGLSLEALIERCERPG